MAEISVSNQSVVIVDDSQRSIVLTLEKFKKLMNLYVRDFYEDPSEGSLEGLKDLEEKEFLKQREEDKAQEERENNESWDVITEDEPFNVAADLREDYDERDE